MACCLALTDGEPVGVVVELIDVVVVMASFLYVQLPLQRPSKTSEMVITVADRVILEHELTRERSA